MTGLGGYHKDSRGQSSSVDTEASRKFDATLFSTLDALEEAKVSYALIGGIAATGLGRPRSTQDIDVFVRPEDAEAVLDLLARRGFRTEQTSPTWLFKAFKDEVLVDVIFRSEGGFYFDDEMREKARKVNYHGRQVPLVSPEDFILIKVAVHSEEGPHHWHDALSVLSHSKIDWDYLLHRSRKAARRLLAFLVYAQSDDIWVPNNVIQQVFANVFGKTAAFGGPDSKMAEPEKSPAPYLATSIREAMAQDERVGALGLDIWVNGKTILLRGGIQSESQRAPILEIVRERAPLHEVTDQLQVADWESPSDLKEII